MFKQASKRKHRTQRGSSLLELMIATVVLMVGVVALAQLVPVALALNSNNRIDSSSLVLAQQQMEQFVEQPLTTFSFLNAQGMSCTLGNSTNFNTVLGSPLVSGTAVIDFTSAKVAGYNFTYTDPEDPTGTSYDVRWAVISTGTASNVTSRRFILGVRKSGGNGPLLPVTLDTLVAK